MKPLDTESYFATVVATARQTRRYEGWQDQRECSSHTSEIHTFYDRKPSNVRWACGTLEAAIPHDHDAPLRRHNRCRSRR